MSLLNYEFDSEYDLMLSAWGKGDVADSNFNTTIEKIYRKFQKEYHRAPIDVSLFIEDSMAYGYDYGFTSVDTAFLEQLESLKELILPDSITEIKMTPKLETILNGNKVLIRGSLDSFAEQFAAENKLHFRPADFVFAKFYFAPALETTVYTMKFWRDGNVSIKQDVSSPGSSAGNTFGGTFYRDIPRNFYKTKTAEDIAGLFGEGSRKCMIEDGRLAAFIEKAKTHKIFMWKN